MPSSHPTFCRPAADSLALQRLRRQHRSRPTGSADSAIAATANPLALRHRQFTLPPRIAADVYDGITASPPDVTALMTALRTRAAAPSPPPLCRPIAAADRLLATSDCMLAAAQPSSPPTSPAPRDIPGLVALHSVVASLTAAVQRLQATLEERSHASSRDHGHDPAVFTHRRRSRPRGRPLPPQQRQPQQQQKTAPRDRAHRVCFYHRRFGAAARHCTAPCPRSSPGLIRRPHRPRRRSRHPASSADDTARGQLQPRAVTSRAPGSPSHVPHAEDAGLDTRSSLSPPFPRRLQTNQSPSDHLSPSAEPALLVHPRPRPTAPAAARSRPVFPLSDGNVFVGPTRRPPAIRRRFPRPVPSAALLGAAGSCAQSRRSLTFSRHHPHLEPPAATPGSAADVPAVPPSLPPLPLQGPQPLLSGHAQPSPPAAPAAPPTPPPAPSPGPVRRRPRPPRRAGPGSRRLAAGASAPPPALRSHRPVPRAVASRSLRPLPGRLSVPRATQSVSCGQSSPPATLPSPPLRSCLRREPSGLGPHRLVTFAAAT